MGSGSKAALPSPDAELVRLCDAYITYGRTEIALYLSGLEAAEDEATRQAIHNRRIMTVSAGYDILARIADLNATTPDGRVAKARVVRAYLGGPNDESPAQTRSACPSERVIWSLAYDVLRMYGAR